MAQTTPQPQRPVPEAKVEVERVEIKPAAAPAHQPAHPAVVGLRWVTTQDSAVLEYTTDGDTWVVVPQQRLA